MRSRVNIPRSLIVAGLSVLIPVSTALSDDTAAPQPAAQELAQDADSAPPDAATDLVSYRFHQLDLHDAPLRDALWLIGDSAGVNLAASNDAAKTNVSIHLRDVTASQAVQALCETNGLYFRKTGDDGVGVVTTLQEFQNGLTVFRQENTRVFTLLYPNAMELAVAVRDIYGDRVHLSIGSEGAYDSSGELSNRFSIFDQLNQRGQSISLNSGTGGGSTSGFGTIGGSSNSTGSSGGSTSNSLLTGNQNNSNQPNLSDQQVLQNLSPQEVGRIANLVRQQGAGVGVDTETLNSLGKRNASIFVTVINRNNQVIVRTSDPEVLDEVQALKEKIDLPTPQVLLEVKVLSVDLSDGFTSIFDYQFGQGPNSVSFSTSAEAAGSPFALNPTSLIYQYVSSNFQARIQLLETHNKITELATPLLLVANNEVSQIFVGQQEPIIQNITSQTTATQGVVTTTPQTTINFEPVGTTLLITPNINADRTVTLRLLEEQSSIIPNGATIPIVGSGGTVTNQPVDVVSATTLTGTFIAKDGLSLALGGLVNENVQNEQEQVPVLGTIPLLGVLFRRQIVTRSRNEVIVVIRPYVISTPSEAEEAGKHLVDASTIHPKAPDLYPPSGEPIGTMNTFLPHEAVRPSPPKNSLEEIFHFYNVIPTDY